MKPWLNHHKLSNSRSWLFYLVCHWPTSIKCRIPSNSVILASPFCSLHRMVQNSGTVLLLSTQKWGLCHCIRCGHHICHKNRLFCPSPRWGHTLQPLFWKEEKYFVSLCYYKLFSRKEGIQLSWCFFFNQEFQNSFKFAISVLDKNADFEKKAKWSF